MPTRMGEIPIVKFPIPAPRDCGAERAAVGSTGGYARMNTRARIVRMNVESICGAALLDDLVIR